MWMGKEIPQSCSKKIPRIFPKKNPCTSVCFRNAIIIPCNILLSFKNTKSLLIYYNSSKIYVYKYIFLFLFSILVAFAGQLIFTLLLSPFIEVLIYYLGPFVDWVTFRRKKITNTHILLWIFLFRVLNHLR